MVIGDNIICRMGFECWITVAIDTNSEYVTFIVFSLQQWLHERSSILRYTNIASLFLLFVQHTPHDRCTYILQIWRNYSILICKPYKSNFFVINSEIPFVIFFVVCDNNHCSTCSNLWRCKYGVYTRVYIYIYIYIYILATSV